MKIGMYGGKFLPLHNGHVNCIIKASNQCDLLYVVLSYSQIRDRNLCNESNFKYIKHDKRLQWLDQIASDLPNVKVISAEDFDDEYNSWEDGAVIIKDKVLKDCGKTINVIFGSEIDYKEKFEKLYENSKYILLDQNRSEFNISASNIRKEGVFKNWDFIPNVCKPFYNKKVAIVGTESCGKSTLVKKLALYFNTEYVEEYGRIMCEKLNTGQPTKEYYPYIAYGQKMLEFEKNQIANKYLFIDTESIVTQYYSQLYTDTTYQLLYEMAKIHEYDYWFLLEPDVEWVDDGLRIHGTDENRKENNNKLKKMLDENEIAYFIIDGDYNNRFNMVINILTSLN